MKEIDFTIDETDSENLQASGNFSVLKAHQALKQYLENASDPSSMLRALCEIHNMLCPDNSEKEKENKAEWEYNKFFYVFFDLVRKMKKKKENAAEWEHCMFFHILFDLVRKTPHDNRAHDDLDKENGYEFHASLTYFYWIVRERCPSIIFEPSNPEEDGFISECAFLARLSVIHMLGDGGLAVCVMKHTLEHDFTAGHLCYNGSIAAASMWILYAGQWLFAQVVKPRYPTSIEGRGMWSAGVLYEGPVFGLER
ncbi:hypothetical protein N7456_001297 [Penicillium angulare]|uniref:Uncharacterized protein n=1 Tax=Penicillium angulare TaxID=116970 RepID=A0A9W9GDR0_9EURO|nr:hypothetical protein N7456_001297 [Penicillium angulare]